MVGTALDGLEAIELADDLDPDAVVIDLHMPLLDGVTAAARLRRDHPNLCLIALTGDDAPALHRAVREAGADEVLLKSELVEGARRTARGRSRESLGREWRGPESNRRHHGFQPCALPTELPRRGRLV